MTPKRRRPPPKPAQPVAINSYVNEGAAFLQSGNLQAAEARFQSALASNPRDAVALNCLGIVARARGDEVAASSLFLRAIRANPQLAEAHSNLGNSLRLQGRHAEAAAKYEDAIRLKPELAEAHNGLGIVRLAMHRWADAEKHLREAVRLNPQSAQIYNNLGNLLRDTGRANDAVIALRRAQTLAPQRAEVLHNLALALRDDGQLVEAKQQCEQALVIAPQLAEAWNTLSSCLINLREMTQAADCMERAVALQPNSISFLINQHNLLRQLDRTDAAKSACDRLVSLQPNEILHAVRRSTIWPAVFLSQAALDEHVESALTQWKGFHEANLTLDFTQLTDTICEPPFNSQFIGTNVRPLKEAYAAIFSKPLTAMNSGGSIHYDCRGTNASGRGRIGIVVTSGHEGIFLKSMSGVLRRLNPDVAELIVFCPPGTLSRMQTDLDARDIRLIPLPPRFDHAAETIRGANCDVLLYWEIGTDASNYFLPFLRLAPLQGTSWGVQVTSGIPNVDFYLSSRLVEPLDASEHYSEKLILADTLLTYQTPIVSPQSTKTRNEFGFCADQHLYVCAQQLGKFHPDFDPLLAGILRSDPAGRIIITDDIGGYSAPILRRRWATTIADVAERMVFLPRLQAREYISLLQIADVLLDPIHFGGVNSTYDGLSLGKAIVTLPSNYHRGRYTFGCYQRMRLDDCIAQLPQDYIRIAVELGTDLERRTNVEAKIKNARQWLFEDPEAVSEHERVFVDLIAMSRASR